MYYKSCKCFFHFVFVAIIPPFDVPKFDDFPKLFLLVETYILLSSDVLSPITIVDEFLYGIMIVGDGNLLRWAFGWYLSSGLESIPACRLFLTLNTSLETDNVSLDLFPLISVGGAGALNGMATHCPFFTSTCDHDRTLLSLKNGELLVSLIDFISLNCSINN